MHFENNENHYMKAYQDRYQTPAKELSVKTVESILTNFFHLNEVMSESIKEVAGILEFALGVIEGRNSNGGALNQVEVKPIQQSNAYNPGGQGMQIENNGNSVEKRDRNGHSKPQSRLAENSLDYNEVIIRSENDRRALITAAIHGQGSDRKSPGSVYVEIKDIETPISKPKMDIKNQLVSNQMKTRNLLSQVTKIHSHATERPFAPNQSESDIQIIETRQVDLDFQHPDRPGTTHDNLCRYLEAGGRPLPSQQSKVIRSEKHIDLTQNRGLPANENLVNKLLTHGKTVKPSEDNFEHYLCHKDKLVFQRRTKDNSSFDSRQPKTQVNLKKVKNPSVSQYNDELLTCLGCLYVT